MGTVAEQLCETWARGNELAQAAWELVGQGRWERMREWLAKYDAPCCLLPCVLGLLHPTTGSAVWLCDPGL